MDEPTSSLTAADTRALFRVINRLKENGIAVIYISHFLEEVQEISDAYTVLRDGETVGSGRMADVTIPEIIEMMVGRKLHEMFPKTDHAIGETLLHVDNLKGRHMPHGVSFDLRRGEILGIAGLVGSGRSETIRSIFGLERAKDGMLTLSGSQKITAAAMFPRRAMEKSVDLLSEDRKEEGLAVSMSIRANTTLSSLTRFASLGGWGLINLRKEGEGVQRWIKDLGIKCQGAWQPVVGLSGGNQQK
ncbi:TPA: sugar ABC transporter, partial [Candidatus Sumerlaeota bacterium]|nr:sugar ABC transporter [Candidatus Sumerlaeota bacterium]